MDRNLGDCGPAHGPTSREGPCGGLPLDAVPPVDPPGDGLRDDLGHPGPGHPAAVRMRNPPGPAPFPVTPGRGHVPV
ncbi:hypothetical protein VR44_37290, partial [Streptomyces katrae]